MKALDEALLHKDIPEYIRRLLMPQVGCYIVFIALHDTCMFLIIVTHMTCTHCNSYSTYS